MANYIYLDIETIPCQDKAKQAALVANAKPPANYKNEDTIAKWREENAADAIAKTSFDGGMGHICQISGISQAGNVAVEYSFRLGADLSTERAMLESFASIIAIGILGL